MAPQRANAYSSKAAARANPTHRKPPYYGARLRLVMPLGGQAQHMRMARQPLTKGKGAAWGTRAPNPDLCEMRRLKRSGPNFEYSGAGKRYRQAWAGASRTDQSNRKLKKAQLRGSPFRNDGTCSGLRWRFVALIGLFSAPQKWP